MAKAFFLVGIGVSLCMLLLNVLSWLKGYSETLCSLCSLRAMVSIPLTLGILAFVAGFLYNRAASRFGGIKLFLEE